MAIIGRLPASYAKLKPGMHCDGGCLYLQITVSAKGVRRASWIFRYARKGHKTRDMGLGSVSDVSLGEAREVAREYRNLIKKGIDPIEKRNQDVTRELAANAKKITFDECAAAYIRQHEAGWTNDTHSRQWPASLRDHVSPVIGAMAVAAIDTSHVMKVLEPIWTIKPETASRVRGRIELILGWATTSGHRTGDNPARWRGHLANLLAPRRKVKAIKHQPSLFYRNLPDFMADLRRRESMAALALEFCILTAVRSADVRNARRADVDGAVWAIPTMSKTGAEHRVPLSGAALAVIAKARSMVDAIGGKVATGGLLFPNDVTGARLGECSMSRVLERMGRKGAVTVHGFRSTFRTWALEQTNFPWELAEMSLGHTVGSRVERAYQRGDGFEKRIAIMQSWANFCDLPIGDHKVISIAARK